MKVTSIVLSSVALLFSAGALVLSIVAVVKRTY